MAERERDERLAAIYAEHFDFVWRTSLSLGVAEAEAEDIAQDVFLVVRRRLPDYDPSRPIRPWLFGIVRRVAKDRRRSATRAKRRLRLLPADSSRGSDNPDPEQTAARSEATDFVEAFLATLDESRRSIFVLSEAEGLSGTEIAEALGINRNTVYTRLRATRQLFAQAIEKRRQ